MTDIQWTDAVWNPVRGCARISPGCEHCYAERMAHRFSGKGQPYEGLTVLGKHGPRWNGTARFVPEKLAEPLSWKKPRRVFVNSMSDLFHADITNEQIAAVFGVMAATPHITYQVLTKRAERLPDWFEWCRQHPMPPTHACVIAAENALRDWRDGKSWWRAPWPLPNVHLGVSVENQAALYRIYHLLDPRVKAAVKWLSCEPLLEDTDIRIAFNHYETTDPARCVHWVVVGGESGPRARACDLRWIRSIVQQCKAARVPCFVKQIGADPWEEWHGVGHGKGRMMLADRAGGDPSEWPEDLRVREWSHG